MQVNSYFHRHRAGQTATHLQWTLLLIQLFSSPWDSERSKLQSTQMIKKHLRLTWVILRKFSRDWWSVFNQWESSSQGTLYGCNYYFFCTKPHSLINKTPLVSECGNQPPISSISAWPPSSLLIPYWHLDKGEKERPSWAVARHQGKFTAPFQWLGSQIIACGLTFPLYW